jgi:cell division protein FtsB
MKAAKYLFALWAGILIYAFLSVSFGPQGFSAYFQLEKERNKQEANIEDLKQINYKLDDIVNSLLYDEDTLAMYAREQGYASKHEKLIRIVGLGVSQKNNNQTGSVIVTAEPQFLPDKTLRVIALYASITVLFCMLMFDILRLLRER